MKGVVKQKVPASVVASNVSLLCFKVDYFLSGLGKNLPSYLWPCFIIIDASLKVWTKLLEVW